MLKIFLVFIIGLFFIGCLPQPFSDIKVSEKEESVKNYILGDENLKNVGDEIVIYGTEKTKQKNIYGFNSLIDKEKDLIAYEYVDVDVDEKAKIAKKVEKNIGKVELKKEQFLEVTHKSKDSNGDIYWINAAEMTNNINNDKYFVYFQVYKDGKIASSKVRLSPKNGGIASDYTYFDENELKNKYFIESEKIEISSYSGSFKWSLVYAGVEGSIIKVFYKEFYDGMARPAFTQELTYDISKDKKIRYKNVLIEVLDANSQTIKYKVVSD